MKKRQRRTHYLSTMLIGIPLLLLLILGAILLYILAAVSFPDRRTSEMTPSSLLMGFQSVDLQTEDGVKLAGYYIPGGGKVIILCHDIDANKADLLPLASVLNQAGYSILLFDFRRHGASGGFLSTLGAREKLDVLAGISFLNSRGIRGDVGLLGMSMGGYAGALAAAESDDISAIILVDPYPDVPTYFGDRLETEFHMRGGPLASLANAIFTLYTRTWGEGWSLQTALAGLKRKSVLIISSQRTVRSDEYCHRLYTIAPEPKELAVIKDFNQTLLVGSDKAPVEERIVRFFKDFLPIEAPHGKVVTADGPKR